MKIDMGVATRSGAVPHWNFPDWRTNRQSDHLGLTVECSRADTVDQSRLTHAPAVGVYFPSRDLRTR